MPPPATGPGVELDGAAEAAAAGEKPGRSEGEAVGRALGAPGAEGSRLGSGGSETGRLGNGVGVGVGRAVGLGYAEHPDGVTDAFVAGGRWEIQVAGDRHAARAQLAPPYDPKGLRVRS